MLDHARVVLSGILPDRRDNLLHANLHLLSEHFKREQERSLYELVIRYHEITGGIITGAALADLLERQGVDLAKTMLYVEAYRDMEAAHVSDEEFRYSVNALKELHQEQLTGEAITTAFEILKRGAEVDRENLQGHRDARTYAMSAFANIDRLGNTDAAPEGDMRSESSDILAEYALAQSGESGIGVLCGIPALDGPTGGVQKGELQLVAGYTNAGKSQFCCQTAWHAATQQSRNVFFATSETVRSTVRRRIIARHSRLPQFGYASGIDSKDIQRGTLSPEEEVVLKEVVHDLDTNPNYGKLFIAQIPRGATSSYLESRVNLQQSLWPVDLLVIDYLALLKPDRPRNSEREEYNDVLKDAKVFAVSFNDGQGVPILSPWQMSQASYREALRNTGMYTLANLGETVEAERTPDQIISLLGQPEAKNEVVAQFLKLRDGEVPGPITLKTNFKNAYFGTKETGGFGSKFTGSFV